MKNRPLILVLAFCLYGKSAWGAATEPSSVPPPPAKHQSEQQSLAGFYVGFGITNTQAINEMSIKKDTWTFNNDAPFTPRGADRNDKEAGVIGDLTAGKVGLNAASFSFGAADSLTGFVGSNTGNSILNSLAQQFKGGAGRPGGFLSFGYGGFVLEKIYLGMETTLDFTGYEHDTAIDTSARNFGTYNAKSCGTVLSVVFRPGIWCDFCQSLLYARAGFYTTHQEISSAYGCVSIIGIAPVVGFGIERKVGALSIRFEGDYRLPAKESGHFQKNEIVVLANSAGDEQNVHFLRNAEMRLKSNGYAARIMVSCPIF
ncbi:MAG: hypothetical protein LBD15_03315 [Holosporales bacterium]|jgi:hypothetical protein|nr:hypothetical protein [Holosporales bacterium]